MKLFCHFHLSCVPNRNHRAKNVGLRALNSGLVVLRTHLTVDQGTHCQGIYRPLVLLLDCLVEVQGYEAQDDEAISDWSENVDKQFSAVLQI